MQYRNDRAGNPISALGFGCMRFPKKGGSIDLSLLSEEMLREHLGFANRAAAKTCSRPGAIPAMPTLAEMGE